MNKKQGLYLSAVAIAVSIALPAMAEDQAVRLNASEIIGSKQKALQLPGSGTVLTQSDLDEFRHTDINRILAEVPGVYVRSEEGYGLRPNIGIRGTPTERSQRITLMEDGILVAPAPYSAPAAYYFPTAGRLAGIEVLKGPAAIANGPYTIAGAINMLSTPIPVKPFGGRIVQELGEDSSFRTHAHVGGSSTHFGWLVEGHKQATDGFNDIDNASDQTGFDKEDVLVKLRLNSDPTTDVYHQFDLKLQHASEDSDQTYVGLTDRDFKADSNRRYGLTREDNMDNEMESFTLGYLLDTGSFSLLTQGYYQDYKRNWYKVDKIAGTGASNAFDCANSGANCSGTLVNQSNAQAILNGNAAAAVNVKANNRLYKSKGLQTRFNTDLAWGSVQHGVEIGARYHEDEEVRDQFVDSYQQGADGSFTFTGMRTPEAKRSKTAKAYSLYLTDEIGLDRLTLTPGVRLEDYRIGDNPDEREVMFGLGAHYQLDANWALLAGVHEGFTPTSTAGTDAEEALNFEAGFRYLDDRLYAEVIGFYSDYDNLIGTCTASTGANCTVGDQFNGGEVEVRGLESRVEYQLVQTAAYSLPVSLSYTWTDSEFKTAFNNSFFGTVEQGDEVPSIPEHQATATVGYRGAQGFAADLRGNWVDGTCTMATCGQFEQVDSYYTVDLSTRYAFNEQTEVYANVINLTDETDDIIARQPYGARGQAPRTALVGVSHSF
ncbi:TonB-dependent receptor family protein [Halopseudomonas sp.]|uniref:TonB-dependent receptor family protein n=1 Tax=Halopseudomonas sp. TaxID=2901191 RepID=UPI003566C815